jgi:hypothetical protein
MERLPNELIDRILGYNVEHFSELIYQGAVCRLWKKIAEESLLWFQLNLKYGVPRNYKSATLMFRLYYCAKGNDDQHTIVRLLIEYREPTELVWDPNSDHPPEPPASLPLHILDLAFQVNTTTVIAQNHKTATELRKWFISYVIYHKKYWKWYCAWMPFFCPPTELLSFIEQVETVAWLFSVLTPTVFPLFIYATEIEAGRLFDCLSIFFFFLRVWGTVGYFSLVIYKLFSGYFKNIQYLNRPMENLVVALTPSPSNDSMLTPIFQLIAWICLSIWWKTSLGVEK